MSKRVIAMMSTSASMSATRNQKINTYQGNTGTIPTGEVYRRERFKAAAIGTGTPVSGVKMEFHQFQEGDLFGNASTWASVNRVNDVNAQYREMGVTVYDDVGDLMFIMSTDSFTGSTHLQFWTPMGSYNTGALAGKYHFEFKCSDNNDGTADYTVVCYNDNGTIRGTNTWTASDKWLTRRVGKVLLMGGESNYGWEAYLYDFLLTSGISTLNTYPMVLHPNEITESTVESAPIIEDLQKYGTAQIQNAPAIYGNEGEQLFYKIAPLPDIVDNTYVVRGIAFCASADSPDDVGIEFNVRETGDTDRAVGPVHDIEENAYVRATADFVELNHKTGRSYTIPEINNSEFGIKFKRG